MLISATTVSASEISGQQTDSVANQTDIKKAEVKGYCRNLFVELGGPSLSFLSLGFDSRIKPGSVFGYRVGLGFTDGSAERNLGDYNVDFRGVSIPLEANAILGKRKSKFELGVGIVPSILNRKETEYVYNVEKTGENSYYISSTEIVKKEGVRVNIMGLLNVGYRYQRQSGFFMRVGFNLLLGSLSCSPIEGVYLMPNIAFGYTLP